MTITNFSNEYNWLSNFYPCVIEYESIKYSSVEHAFVAAKTNSLDIRQLISRIPTPGLVKRIGKHLILRDDWEQIKLNIMRELLLKKFQIPELKELLLSTGNAELVEGNTWDDTFWGVCNGAGSNNLGKLLMGIRIEIAT